jgi:hypothetical protein
VRSVIVERVGVRGCCIGEIAFFAHRAQGSLAIKDETSRREYRPSSKLSFLEKSGISCPDILAILGAELILQSHGTKAQKALDFVLGKECDLVDL